MSSWFSRIPVDYVKYYAKGFHPWDDDNSDIIQQWIDETQVIANEYSGSRVSLVMHL